MQEHAERLGYVTAIQACKPSNPTVQGKQCKGSNARESENGKAVKHSKGAIKDHQQRKNSERESMQEQQSQDSQKISKNKSIEKLERKHRT